MPETKHPPKHPAPARPGAVNKAGTKPAPSRGFPRDRLALILMGLLVIALAAVVYKFAYGPADDWAFNRPEAQLPSLQEHHSVP